MNNIALFLILNLLVIFGLNQDVCLIGFADTKKMHDCNELLLNHY